jgi:prepilin-type N-terminal cleavage/methylation domain-containing protein
MFSRRNRNRRFAFTLLEMIIALMITSMIVMSLYRFVSAHLATVRMSTELGEERDALDAVIKLVQGQLEALPASAQSGALTGKAYKFRGYSNDEMTWNTGPGAGLLTTAATGEYKVTLTVQPVDSGSAETELGLRRQPAPGNKSSVELLRGSNEAGRYNWQSLIRPMAALEIRYYDTQSHSWTDQWTDENRRPGLVRLRLQKRSDDAPIEAVISVPSARFNQ